MPSWVIDMVITVLILGMTYALSSEGVWGAALMFFNVLFAGLIAFNFYETLARLLAENAPGMAGFADMICMMGLFLVSLIMLRVYTDSAAPAVLRLPMPIYHLGRLGFGFLASCVAMAVVICGFEAAPVHRKIFGVVDYAYAPPWHMGLDHKWLAFVQYTTGNTFPTYDEEYPGEPYEKEFPNTKVFDRKGAWLIDHQNGRPYHPDSATHTVPYSEAPPEPAAPGP